MYILAPFNTSTHQRLRFIRIEALYPTSYIRFIRGVKFLLNTLRYIDVGFIHFRLKLFFIVCWVRFLTR